MKFFMGVVIGMFLLCGFSGCERTERAVDLYKKTQSGDRQKEEGKQIEPQRRAVENKIRDAYNAKDKEYREKEEAAQIK